MKKDKQIFLCKILLLVGLIGFILHVFVFSAPDGIVGLLLCLLNVYFIVGSVVKLCQLSKTFRNRFVDFLDLLFFIR